MQSSDPSVTIGTKFSHFQESSSECDSLQTWASVQPASSSQRISQIRPAAVSPPLQQHASEPGGMRGAGRVGKGAHRGRRRGKATPVTSSSLCPCCCSASPPQTVPAPPSPSWESPRSGYICEGCQGLEERRGGLSPSGLERGSVAPQDACSLPP